MIVNDGYLEQLLISQTIQISCLALIVALVVRVACRRHPHLAYLLWMLVVFKCLTPPLWQCPVGIFSWANRLTNREIAASPPTDSTTELAVRIQAEPTAEVDPNCESTWRSKGIWSGWRLNSIASMALGVWIVGSCVTGLLLAIAWWRYRRTVERSSGFSREPVHHIMESLRRELGVRQKVRLMITEAAIGPAVFGLFRPTIIVSEQLIAQKSVRQLRPLLGHELVHVRRFDLLCGAVQMVAQVVWWFHPFAWWANREVCRWRERCCDQEVVASLRLPPNHYIRSLIEVMELSHNTAPGFIASGMRTSFTHERLSALMGDAKAFRRTTPWWSWTVVMVASVVVLPGGGVARSAPSGLTSDVRSRAVTQSTAEIPASVAQLIDQIDRLGGRVELEESSDVPHIVGVSLAGKNITSGDLVVLKDLPSLRKLTLYRTKIEDIGLGLVGEQVGVRSINLKQQRVF